ncbi:MAG: TIGR01777 family oxidoreductase [Deltaproteobacteria bacterium]|nr:TIGR01777 family oxidoreductase [Deltaproteobacteria bacterium]
MPEFHLRTPLAHPPKVVWEWHQRRATFERLVPPWMPMVVGQWAPVAPGARQSFRIRKGVRWSWTVRITKVEPGQSFTDVQETGPFGQWEHEHRILPDESGGCVLEDHIHYEFPLQGLGASLVRGPIARDLERAFSYRHACCRRDLQRHAPVARHGPKRVAITGASGLIGSALTRFLESGGHQVYALVRRPVHHSQEIQWRPDAERIDAEALEGMDAVVHLAGEPLAQFWTEDAKQRIRASRIAGTRLLAETLAKLKQPPSVLVSGSAIGIYGNRRDEVIDEESALGQGFLADVVAEWESATEAARAAGIRVANLRTGIVLHPSGGFLGTLLLPYRLGMGGRIGDGNQYLSWIALDDLVGLIHHILFNPALDGPVNGTAPDTVPQIEMARTLARVLRRPTLLRIPAAEIRLLLREMGEETLLQGQRVYPERAAAAGFTFHHPDLEGTLRMLLGRT